MERFYEATELIDQFKSEKRHGARFMSLTAQQTKAISLIFIVL